MKPTNEQIQALKAAAENAIPAMQRLLMIPNDELTDSVFESDGDIEIVNKFNLLAGPETILSLLAERDADKALIVEQAKRIDELREWNAGLAQESLDRQQRIAELVHNHRIHAARLIAELGQLKERIAELEASHTKLRGSMAAIHNTIRLDGAGVSLSALLSASKRAYEESAAAAGITLVVGE